MYEILTGHPPFEADDRSKTFDLIVNVNFTIPNYVCTHARDLISKLLRKEPKERITLADALCHAWFNLEHVCHKPLR